MCPVSNVLQLGREDVKVEVWGVKSAILFWFLKSSEFNSLFCFFFSSRKRLWLSSEMRTSCEGCDGGHNEEVDQFW